MTFHQFSKHLFFLLLFVLVIPKANAASNEQLIKVTLRSIGHEFLLQLDDSTSRVLPIEKKAGRYSIRFENEFSFEPDALLLSTQKVLQASKSNDSYIVEVEKCGSNEVIYSFKASLSQEDNLTPCKLRELPLDCYVFYFTAVDVPLLNPEPESGSNAAMRKIYLLLIMLLGAGILFYFWRRKNKQKVNADLIHIGQFQFDQKAMKLMMKARSIELSSKESDLLFLLFSNENKTLEREYILKVVWGDEGDYVGRTLDVFISKLRKKLEADASLKIVNIRGVGYRFVMN